MNFFPPKRLRKINGRPLFRVLFAVTILLLPACKKKPPLHPNIATPAIAVETLDAQNPFFTEAARATISAKKPQWLATSSSEEEHRAFLHAAQSPALWRQLDRKLHFDAVLLCGDPGEYRSLLNHLIGTKDWTLTYLDQTSLVFRRTPAKKWNIDDFHALLQKFANYPASDRAASARPTPRSLVSTTATFARRR